MAASAIASAQRAAREEDQTKNDMNDVIHSSKLECSRH
jgi:hypothetical protein